MSGKNKALKGFVVFACILMASAFLARTVQTITTPKIKRIQAVRGKLEDRINVQGEVNFGKGESFAIEEAIGFGAVVEKVTAKEGYLVKKGDLLFTMVSGEYAGKKASLQDELLKATREMANEYAAHIKLIQTTQHNDYHQALLEAIDDYYLKRSLAMTEAIKAGYTLEGDVATWKSVVKSTPQPATTPAPDEKKNEKTSAAPASDPKATKAPAQAEQAPTKDYRDAPEAVQKAMVAAYEAMLRRDEADLNLRNIYKGIGGRRTFGTTFDYIKKLEGFKEKVADAENKLLELENRNQKIKQVVAARDGYLTQFSLKVGDSYDGIKPAYSLSQDGEKPYIRCDITALKKNITNRTKATVEGIKKELSVKDIQAAADGKKYALIELNDKTIAEAGGLGKLMNQSIPVTLIYKSDKTTALIPAGALRTDQDGSYYVFTIVQTDTGLLGSRQYTVKKKEVNVLEKSNKMVALSDESMYMDIADQEDRTIKDGQTVMEYVD